MKTPTTATPHVTHQAPATPTPFHPGRAFKAVNLTNPEALPAPRPMTFKTAEAFDTEPEALAMCRQWISGGFVQRQGDKWVAFPIAELTALCEAEKATPARPVKVKVKTPTPAALKALTRETEPFFFTRETMVFFGDRMSNYGTRNAGPIQTRHGLVDCWELYRKRTVKHGLSDSAFFCKSTLRRVFPSTK